MSECGETKKDVVVVKVVSCGTKGVGDIRGTLRCLKRRAIISEGPRILLGTSGMVLPNIKDFNSTVRGLGGCKLIPMVRRVIRGKAPFLKVYLKLRLLFRDDSRAPKIRNLKVLGKGVLHVPPDAKLGVPRVN